MAGKKEKKKDVKDNCGCKIRKNGDIILLETGCIIGAQNSDGSCIGMHPWGKGVIPAPNLKAMREGQQSLVDDYDC
jgi:hypothetical protein